MWQIDTAKNAIKAVLPYQRQLRRLKHRFSANPHQIDEASVYPGAFDQVVFLREAGIDPAGKTILEVGSGWYPVIPLVLHLAGAKRVILTDAHALMDLDTVKAATAFLLDRKTDIAARLGRDETAIEAALSLPEGADFQAALDQFGFTYAVPFDYATTDERVDVIYSHTVMEHIPPEAIEDLLGHWRRILNPGGVISHGIDHSDHRANVDANLSRVDFLKYSERMWKVLCINPQDYTNRLRHSDYMQMFEAAGYAFQLERALVDDKALDDLASFDLPDRFKTRSRDDLAILWSNIIARPA